MSLWGFDGGENTLTTWSSLSQFDDMVWNEFGENGDHVVPHPNGNQTAWTTNGDHRKKLNCEGNFTDLSNQDSPASKGGSNSSETSESDQRDGDEGRVRDDKNESNGEEVPMQDILPGGSWSDLGSVVDLPLESQPFDSGPLPEPQEREDMSGSEELKDQSVSMLSEDVQLYMGEEDGSMVTDPFSLTEDGSQPGGLELFVDENTASKAVSLLDLGWANIGNLDDMDKLFRNNDASFEPVMAGNTDGLEWPSASPNPVGDLDTGPKIEKNPPDCERGKPTVVKVEVDAAENKQQISCDESQSVRSSDKAQASVEELSSDVASPKSSSLQGTAPAQQPPVRRPDKNDVVHEAKAHRARRHAANRKRSEERFRRGTSYRKLSPGPPYAVPHGDVMQLPLRMLGQPSHLQPVPPPSGLQVSAPASGLLNVPPHQFQMPRSVPYIQVGYPLHHMPMMSSCPPKPMSRVQYPQPMFVELQPSSIHPQKPPNQHVKPMPSPLAPKVPFQAPGPVDHQQQHTVRPSFDASCRPPTCSPSMTPQEKLEKLRRRQQMQARIAVEQQQQQLLASQNGGGIEPSIFHTPQHIPSQSLVPSQPGRLLTESSEGRLKSPMDTEQKGLVLAGVELPATASGENEEDSSLEGSMLCQLEMTISQLDIGTRLVIRNALYRLARSARKRRAAGGENGCSSQSSGERNSGCNAMESSTASDSPSCRGSRATSMSEVETETNPIDRTIAKLLFYKPPPQYLPGPMYIPENSPYSGVPQLPAGVPNAPWGWSSAAVPHNGVGPPGPPPISTSLPWVGKSDERLALAPAWAPLPVMNGYRPPALPGYHMDPRFSANFPVSKLRDNVAGLSVASAPKSERKEETSMSPVPSLQTESGSLAGHVVRNHMRVSNPPTSGASCQVVVNPKDLELKGDACNTTMEMLGDTPPLSSTAFVPDRIPARATISAGVQDAGLGSQFKSANDSEQTLGQGNDPCITADPVQFLSSTHQDEPGNIDQKPLLESLSFPTGRLDMASHPKEGILEELR